MNCSFIQLLESMFFFRLILIFLPFLFSFIQGCVVSTDPSHMRCQTHALKDQTTWATLGCTVYFSLAKINTSNCHQSNFRQIDLAFDSANEFEQFLFQNHHAVEELFSKFDQSALRDRHLTIVISNSFQEPSFNLAIDKKLLIEFFPRSSNRFPLTTIKFDVQVIDWSQTHVSIHSDIRHILPTFNFEILLHNENDQCSIKMNNFFGTPWSQMQGRKCHVIKFIDSSELFHFVFLFCVDLFSLDTIFKWDKTTTKQMFTSFRTTTQKKSFFDKNFDLIMLALATFVVLVSIGQFEMK